MARRPSQASNFTGLGALFIRNRGGQVIGTLNIDNETNGQISAAAFIANRALENVTSLNILIIDDPTQYANVDNSNESQLDSSIIVVGTDGNPSGMSISLYFRGWNQSRSGSNGNYVCSFYNANTSKWDRSGCTTPMRNTAFDRFECSCNHLSIFALLWTPVSSTFCKNSTYSLAPNGTCVLKVDAQVRCAISFSAFV